MKFVQIVQAIAILELLATVSTVTAEETSDLYSQDFLVVQARQLLDNSEPQDIIGTGSNDPTELVVEDQKSITESQKVDQDVAGILETASGVILLISLTLLLLLGLYYGPRRAYSLPARDSLKPTPTPMVSESPTHAEVFEP